MPLCAAVGCATPHATVADRDARIDVEGVITAIDLQPWTWDGDAVVTLGTATGASVAVRLPARWNLCAASPVRVDALAPGQAVRASGAADGAGGLVVCAGADDGIVPAR